MVISALGFNPLSSESEMQEIDGGFNWWGAAAVVLGVAAITVTDGAATPAVLGMGRALGALSFLSTMKSA